MVLAAAVVSLKACASAPAVAICAKLTHPSPVHRSMRNSDSLLELSVHVRSTRDWVTAVAPRLVGAAGGDGGAGVVAYAVFEYADGPAALAALTRYP